jgi:hypothetical protein
MAWDELGLLGDEADKPEDDDKSRERWIGVWIGVLAVILAICAMGGNNAGKDATLKHIEAANTWAFFQAKNMRRQSIRLAVDDLVLQLAADPALAPQARAAIDAKLKEYRDLDAVLTTDKVKNEGLDELFVKARGLEAERDTAMAQDPYFDYAEAALQIAIILASIAIITGGNKMLVGSFVLGALGALLTLNGYTLAVSLPGIG